MQPENGIMEYSHSAYTLCGTKRASRLALSGFLVVASSFAVGCGSDDEKSVTEEPIESTPGDSQTPGTGKQAVTAWLEGGAYEEWACEAEVHEARAPSPHGFNRICSNFAIAAIALQQGNWPKGAAAVKELYASADAAEPAGYAVYLKMDADSDHGKNWYWYEILPSGKVVADGMGTSGGAKDICVKCHDAAGADAMHTPSLGGRDQVYTPVPAGY
jgi:hypothetical protein